MKDKVAHSLIKDLAAKLGCDIVLESGTLKTQPWLDDGKLSPIARIRFLERDFKRLEEQFAATKEEARPTCKTCGQKIQDGFRAGDIETLAASVKRTKR